MKTKSNTCITETGKSRSQLPVRIAVLAITMALMSFVPANILLQSSQNKISHSKKVAIKWKIEEINLGEITQNNPYLLNSNLQTREKHLCLLQVFRHLVAAHLPTTLKLQFYPAK